MLYIVSVNIKRIINIVLTMLVINTVLLFRLPFPGPVMVIAVAILAIMYIKTNIIPRSEKHLSFRLVVLLGGYELFIISCICLTLELILYTLGVYRFNIAKDNMIVNAVIAGVLMFLMFFNGLIRIFVCSSQLGIKYRVLLLLFFWVPIVNILILVKCCRIAGLEFYFSRRSAGNDSRREKEQVCATKYPLLMLHGIFFRDSPAFNYWGRIPDKLIRNGAKIFYGKQDSSASVERTAQELAVRIEELIKQTGSPKVNIIAHSKSGLDARYAISRFGMDQYVASLTTINTPHRGTYIAGALTEKMPEKLTDFVASKYSALYQKLGDSEPDFLSGLNHLTVEKCAELNVQMPDMPGVLYLSVGSVMKSATSAAFPQNVGYLMIFPKEGENDGLVPVPSMSWGEWLGLIRPTSNEGIGHGDMIDLTRKNIKGFDVCEFYVELVAGLKKRGC